MTTTTLRTQLLLALAPQEAAVAGHQASAGSGVLPSASHAR